MYDLGLPWNIWHPLIMRNPHSVMFEVAYCVMLYTTVLALEFSPIVLEHFNLHGAEDRPQHDGLFVILGVILSTLHQSSLGTLYLIMPEQAASVLVQPAAAGVLLSVGHCGGPGDDDLRIVDEFEVFRPRTRVADPAAISGACSWWCWRCTAF